MFSEKTVVPFIALTTVLFVLAVGPSAAAQNVCADSVQGRIAWIGAKNTSWTAANLAALCKGAETSIEPGKCFKRVMGGTVSYGGGTIWNPTNALRLCAGTLDANARIACFEGKITQGMAWAAAADQCVRTASPALGSVNQRPVLTPKVTPKPGVPPVKALPKAPPKTATPPATPSPTCPAAEDCDGDGYSSATGDCDERDATRYPGATEVADFEGHDEDCNQHTIGNLDADGDGFVDSRVCNGTNCGLDCDDTRPAVNPHAAELPNRRDDNCNGLIDDDLEGWWNPASQ